MAIAPLPQQEQFELLEIPWPKPSLRLVSTPDPVTRVREQRPPQAVHSLRVDRTADVDGHRRSTPSRTVARRRRLLVSLVVGAALLMLSLPIHVLGGQTLTGQSALGGVTSGLPDGSIYVVQSGDTLSSIALRINPDGDQAALVRALRTTVGSPVVVPGERIVLP